MNTEEKKKKKQTIVAKTPWKIYTWIFLSSQNASKMWLSYDDANAQNTRFVGWVKANGKWAKTKWHKNIIQKIYLSQEEEEEEKRTDE